MRVKAGWVALAGMVLVISGFVMGVKGAEKSSMGESQAYRGSVSTYGDLLGFDAGPSARQDLAEAQRNIDSGHTQATMGTALLIGGGLLILSSIGLALSRRNSPVGAAPRAALPGGGPAPAVAGRQQPAVPDVARAPCPTCGESIAVAAKVCRFCSRDIPAGSLRTNG